MEYEVRYYFPTEKLESIIEKLKNIQDLNMKSRCYEKTSQFDHTNDEMSFYSKEIDGRFRIRVTKNDETAKCKISCKRRIPDTKATDVNKEEEVEVRVQYDDYDNLMFLINNVLKMKDVESYERYRTIFVNDEVETKVITSPILISSGFLIVKSTITSLRLIFGSILSVKIVYKVIGGRYSSPFFA